MSDRAYAKIEKQQKVLTGLPAKSGLLQRTCTCGESPGIDGLCAECRKKRLTQGSTERGFEPTSIATEETTASVNSLSNESSHFGQDFSQIPLYPPQRPVQQTKLKINQSGDVYEQQADQVAEQVMRMTDEESLIPDDEDEAPVSLMRKQSSQVGNHTVADAYSVPPIVDNVLNGGRGQPLDQATRAFMEPRFGHNFSQVRIHTDARAAESAQVVNALAYTVGRDVVFGAGQYTPNTHMGKKLIAHELMHTIQQQNSQLAVIDSLAHERKAETIADAVHSHRPISRLTPIQSGLVSRQKLRPHESPKIQHNFGLAPQLFRKPNDAPAATKSGECEEFPGGSTDCEFDEKTGTVTGKVTHSINETNPCARPCVEQHEAVHVEQLKTFCQELRDCYLSAEKSKQPDLFAKCAKMAIFGRKKRECPAYKVSIRCMEKRLKNAKECQSKENKAYGKRKLASEKCFRDKYCGGSGGK